MSLMVTMPTSRPSCSTGIARAGGGQQVAVDQVRDSDIGADGDFVTGDDVAHTDALQTLLEDELLDAA